MNIILLSSIAPEAIEALERHHDVTAAFDVPVSELPALLADREVAVLRSGAALTAELLDAAPELRLIVRAGSGIDNIDLDAAGRRGLRVVRVPGPSAQAVAEFTFALMLAVMRKAALADRLIRAGRWPKRELGGHLLRGKTLGVIGAGSIGGRVGELGAAWDMRVLACVNTVSENRRRDYAGRGMTLTAFDTVVAEADILSLHLPLEPATRHLVSTDLLARMKPGAYLINTARGGVVDEDALCQSLRSGHLSGAALDVHAREGDGIPPLAEFPNVVLTPHIGAMALESQGEIGEKIVAICTAFARSATVPEIDGVVPVL